ncbi:MAG: 5-formyltetrahydrofolate cyclo-ligase [Thermoprotei archaeon]|nr:MAG: 5-formyltetrahydrofolate cyclo-ligase [Thermoprotei archaeon]RLE98157.1 MAG: 5-formyltetrahydrofolate cyclo-ligase [Thermoprotei archaeon]
MSSIRELKARLREEVWRKMEEYEIATAPRPCYGKIPAFLGSRVAAMKIARRSFFREAEVVYSTLDLPQRHLREAALEAEKMLVMALPRFKGFVIVNGKDVPRQKAGFAATLRGALAYGRRVKVPEGLRVDVFIMGSVAVDEKGGRLGRGDGSHDLEYAILRELRLVDDETIVVTTVHDVQLIPEVPMYYHDVPVDYIATPKRLIRAEGEYRKPRGIFWDMVDSELMERIPLLKVLAGLA